MTKLTDSEIAAVAIKDAMDITACKNLRWANPEHTLLECVVSYHGHGAQEFPFSVDGSCPLPWSQEIWAATKTGAFGPIAAYDPEAAPPSVRVHIADRLVREQLWKTQQELISATARAVLTGEMGTLAALYEKENKLKQQLGAL